MDNPPQSPVSPEVSTTPPSQPSSDYGKRNWIFWLLIPLLTAVLAGGGYVGYKKQIVPFPLSCKTAFDCPAGNACIKGKCTKFEMSPAEQQNFFARSRNQYRKVTVQMYATAIKKYITDHQGTIPASITMSPTHISKSGADLCALLTGQYLSALSTEADPKTGNSSTVTDCDTNYDTNFTVARSADGTVTVAAPMAELGETISYTK